MAIKKPKIKLPKIPIFSTPDTALMTSSQEHLPIADIVDGIVIYKDGGASIVLETTSLNFGLLSGAEQEAVIAAYAALINSLSFALQIMVRTQKKNIGSYLEYLDSYYDKIENPKLKSLMKSYRGFIQETVKKKNVLGKRFFMIVPFTQFELGVAKSFTAFAKRGRGTLPFTKDYVIKKAKIALYPKRDHIIRQAARLGIRATQLNNAELVKLFYEYYNPDPESVKTKTFEEDLN